MNGQLSPRGLFNPAGPQNPPAGQQQPQGPQSALPVQLAMAQPDFNSRFIQQQLLLSFPQNQQVQQQQQQLSQQNLQQAQQFIQSNRQPQQQGPSPIQQLTSFQQIQQNSQQSPSFSFGGSSSGQAGPVIYNSVGNNPANVRFIDDSSFLRRKRQSQDKKLSKRGLVLQKDGSIIDDTLVTLPNFFDGLTQFGIQSFKVDQIEHTKDSDELEEEIREHDREPAEGEVQAVMSLCSKCQVEPFKGALVMGWRDIKTTSQYALKALSTGSCGEF